MLPEQETGWLAGVRDPHLAKALAVLHRDPARQWTVTSLSKEVGLSRTRLAERFRHFLGMSPITYLTDWRMKQAAEALQKTRKSVLEVALDLGYSSEAAFNRAFKRAYKTPPAHFRRTGKPDRTPSSRRLSTS
jgi:transcriptional regulator GlxA family with amidase domain